MIVKKSQFNGEYVLHPAGLFPATLKTIKVKESQVEGWSDQFMFVFETNQEDEGGNRLAVFHFTSQTWSPNSKLGRLIMSLTGIGFDDIHDDLDLEELIGWSGQIVIEHEKKNGKVRAVISSFINKKPKKKSASVDDDDIPF